MIIEPCCCDRQVPKLLKAGQRFLVTNGDVTLEKWLSAVGAMLPNGFCLVMMAEAVDEKMLRTLRRYLVRGWASEVKLLTREDQRELVVKEMADVLTGVQYATHPSATDGLLAFLPREGEQDRHCGVLTGRWLSQKTAEPTMLFYTGYYGNERNLRDDDGYMALAPVLSRIKTASVALVNENDNHNDNHNDNENDNENEEPVEEVAATPRGKKKAARAEAAE